MLPFFVLTASVEKVPGFDETQQWRGFQDFGAANKKHNQITSIISKATRTTADVIKINAIGADPEYIYSVADLPHFRTRHEQRT